MNQFESCSKRARSQWFAALGPGLIVMLADTEKMTCTCPDYRTRKEACKHLFAAMLFVKNRGKQTIADPEGHTNSDEQKQPANTHTEAHNKDFDKQATITRLAVLNTATEILKTHRKPIEFNDIVSLAAQLETWALGGKANAKER